jgi:hypothetical protein
MSFASAAGLTPADHAILDLVRRTTPALREAAIMKRLALNDRFDLVLAIASPAKIYITGHGEYVWSSQNCIGLFMQERMDASRIFRLATEPGPNDDCYTRVEHMTAQDLVLSCVGEKWSTYDNQKFIYDIRAKALIKHLSYAPFRAARVVQGRRGPQFVMSDTQRQLVVEVDSVTGVPRVVPASERSIGTPAPPPDPVAEFGPGKEFRLLQKANQYGSAFPVIVERRGQRETLFALPQSDLRTWRQARPDDAKSGLVPNAAEMNEQIGPHQLEGDRLWFGKTFYNGEGSTGVGGFGYFDTLTRSWHIYSPPAIRQWSVSAILVEPDFIWLALYRRGEFGDNPGPLLRFHRTTEQVDVFNTGLTVTHMAVCGDALCIAGNGLAVLKDGELRTYFVDKTSSGDYRMAARNVRFL